MSFVRVRLNIKKIGTWLRLFVDSGTGEAVAPPDAFPQYPVMPTDASINGLEYTAAGGHPLPNKGATKVLLETLKEAWPTK